MGKEQCLIIIILIVGIVTSLPVDEAIFVDSSQLSAVGSSNVESKLPSQSTCGMRKAPNFRIVGGSDSQLGAWPWIVALGYKHFSNGSYQNDNTVDWLCGGTLISNSHVLTICSCVSEIGKRVLVVARLGELNLDPTIEDGATPLDVPIKRIIRHKQYNSRSEINNIALLVLEKSITFTALIQPICLPQLPNIKNIDMENSFPYIAGWGTTEYLSSRSSFLKEVRVPITNLTECINAYADIKHAKIDDRVICAGEEGKESCYGDSGSPLMLFNEKQFYLMGLASYGFTCDEPNYPGLYTRVPYFLDWILERINN